MKERFEGKGHKHLIDAIKRQDLVAGDVALAKVFVKKGELLEFSKGDKIITEGGEDNDVYMIIAGSVSIVIKGNEINIRRPGQTIGEMAGLEASQKRSATNVALDTVVTLKLSSADFMSIGDAHPQIWLPIARELARRLLQRNDLIPPPNEYPKLFIISSAEALDVARAVQAQLERDVFSTVWTDGVFFAGGYPLESLEKAVGESDFAVAIAQADDIVTTRGKKHPTLRDNVLFELGLFMGKLTRYRAILLHPRVPGLKLPSDMHGLTPLSFTQGKPDELSARLGPACNEIRKMVKNLGVRTLKT
jgi:CRP/FNR family cyclic AMP-dependent transcriptional regulator